MIKTTGPLLCMKYWLLKVGILTMFFFIIPTNNWIVFHPQQIPVLQQNTANQKKKHV